jgi:hypothetical protein
LRGENVPSRLKGNDRRFQSEEYIEIRNSEGESINIQTGWIVKPICGGEPYP